ncbi:3-isopropylmalate dehydratase small subunit [Thiotrichales bacterium HSG1]|nr:3-isopropylmalate dehydratase small subunit [Thiotrichales bacterium HSG1]
MQKFTTLTGLVVPLDRSNIDTDAIIPKQFLKSIHKSGFGPNLFDEWRYLDHGEPGQNCTNRPLNKDFILNQADYQGGEILLTRHNFGCGSSREHAPWALLDYGFRAIIASSFADIFYNNCFKNGILPIALDKQEVDSLFTSVIPNYKLTIDLSTQVVNTPNGEKFSFEIDNFSKYCLLNGLDDIDLTLQHADAIKAYENKQKQITPWLF